MSESFFKDLENMLKGKSKIASDFEKNVQAKGAEKAAKKYIKEKNLVKKKKLGQKLKQKYELDPAAVARAYTKHNIEPQPEMWYDGQQACGLGVMLYDYCMKNGLDLDADDECDACGAPEDEDCEADCECKEDRKKARGAKVNKKPSPEDISDAVEADPDQMAVEKLGLKPLFVSGFVEGFDSPDPTKVNAKAKSEEEKGYANGVAVRQYLAKKGMLAMPNPGEND